MKVAATAETAAVGAVPRAEAQPEESLPPTISGLSFPWNHGFSLRDQRKKEQEITMELGPTDRQRE